MSEIEYQLAVLTLKSKTESVGSNAEIKLYLTNREIVGVPAQTIDGSIPDVYVPILDRLGEVGQSMDVFMPRETSFEISINCKPGSFGYERRFVDLLDRYALVEQPVSVYYGYADNEGQEPTWTIQARGVMQSPRLSQDYLSIRVNNNPIQYKYLGSVIDADRFPDAPQGSYGQTIPIVFGDWAEVQPIPLDSNALNAEGDPDPQRFAIASSLGIDSLDSSFLYPVHISGTGSYAPDNHYNVYAKAHSGFFREVYLPDSEKYTSIDGGTGGLNNRSTSGASVNIFDTSITERLYKITVPTPSPISSALELRLVSPTSGSGHNTNGEWIIKIYSHDKLDGTSGSGFPVPSQVVYQASIKKSDYASSIAATSTTFSVWVAFDKPMVWDTTKFQYSISIQVTESTNSALTECKAGGSGNTVSGWDLLPSSTGAYWQRNNSRDVIAWCFYNPLIDFDNLGDQFGVSLVDDKGFGVHGMIIAPPQALPASIAGVLRHYNDLPFVVSMKGIEDDYDGTITGTSRSSLYGGDAPINRPDHILRMLAGKGTSALTWELSGYDTNLFSAEIGQISNPSSAYYRKISGTTKSKETLRSTMQAIAENHMLQIVPVVTSTEEVRFSCLPYQAIRSPVVTLTDNDIEILSFYQLDATSVINDFVMRYGRTYRSDPTNAIIGGYNFSGFQYSRRIPSYLVSVYGQSRFLFGSKDLSRQSFDMIGDENSAATIIEAYLRVFSEPWNIVEVNVPLRYYQDLKIMDSVFIQSYKLPAFFGTSEESSFPLFDGDETDPRVGRDRPRANLYQAEIRSNFISNSSDSAAKRKLTLRLITNSNEFISEIGNKPDPFE